jgi:hypothetical protein
VPKEKENNFYSPREAAVAAGMSIGNVYSALWDQRIRGIQKDGKWKIPRLELDRFLTTRRARKPEQGTKAIGCEQ